MNGISTQTLNILSCGRVTRFGNDTSSTLNKVVAVVAYTALAALTLTLSIRISERLLHNRRVKIVENTKASFKENLETAKQLFDLYLKREKVAEPFDVLNEQITKIKHPRSGEQDHSLEAEAKVDDLEKQKKPIKEKLDKIDEKIHILRSKINKNSIDQIVGALFLGDSTVFNNLGRRINLENFKAIFTATNSIGESEYKNNIANNNLDGFYLGQSFADDIRFLPSLYYNLTFPNRPLSEEKGKELGDVEDYTLILQSKQKELDKKPITEWFEATFQELDKALFEDKKTLVHCSQGVSRSPTIVAAYLINRFGLTAEEAMVYLISKRVQVLPGHFYEPLQEYQKNLFAERNSAAAAEGKKLPHPPKQVEDGSGNEAEMSKDKAE